MEAVQKIFLHASDKYGHGEAGLQDLAQQLLKIRNMAYITSLDVFVFPDMTREEAQEVTQKSLAEAQMDEVFWTWEEVEKALPRFYNEVKMHKAKIQEANIQEGQAQASTSSKLPLHFFTIAPLPGQYDQKADAASQCAELVLGKAFPCHTAKIYALLGEISDEDLEKLQAYLVNPLENHLIALDDLGLHQEAGTTVSTSAEIEGFMSLSREGLESFQKAMGLSASIEDLLLIQEYFKGEDREPRVAEIRILDTYWSDHCRHTTFHTALSLEPSFASKVEAGQETKGEKLAYQLMKEELDQVAQVGKAGNELTLMKAATYPVKALKEDPCSKDLDLSEEINAASFRRNVEGDDLIIYFKNETHNHPTEIEPFGGAATCIGGAIRDPLSGRSYVHQAMRITGASNPLTPLEETRAHKLPQRSICQRAAEGYSSYGNQIGLPTGQVREFYHPGFEAKRMELGAVVAMTPASNVCRKTPEKGDVVLLIGGRTGRDGIGGATGSSKVQTESSLETSGAEVQKGNPVTERKLQKLFSRPDFAPLVKRANDFGAGGVSVAIGELADSLDIHLEKVRLKYQGLKPEEIAISESQERMAIVCAKEDAPALIQAALEENVEAYQVAEVTDSGYLQIFYDQEPICVLKRSFIDSNGAQQQATFQPNDLDLPSLAAYFKEGPKSSFALPVEELPKKALPETSHPFAKALLEKLLSLEEVSQDGLSRIFDSTVGAASVFSGEDGLLGLAPSQGMVSQLKPYANTSTAMTFGYLPRLMTISPFHGGFYAVLESLMKLVALNVDIKQAKLSYQEYFERMTSPEAFARVLSAILGANRAALATKTLPIGGKDSMSGNFEELKVPPTLVSFAINLAETSKVIPAADPQASPAAYFMVRFFDPRKHPSFLPAEEELAAFPDQVAAYRKVIEAFPPRSAVAGGRSGLALPIIQAAFSSNQGFTFHAPCQALDPKDKEAIPTDFWLQPRHGALILSYALPSSLLDQEEAKEKILESKGKTSCPKAICEAFHDPLEAFQKAGLEVTYLGHTNSEDFDFGELSLPRQELLEAWLSPLQTVYPSSYDPALKPSRQGLQQETLALYDQALKDLKEKAAAGIQSETQAENQSGIQSGAKSETQVETLDATQMAHVINRVPSYQADIFRKSSKKVKILVPFFPGSNCEDDLGGAFLRAKGGDQAEVRTLLFRNLTPELLDESRKALIEAIQESNIIALPGGFSLGDEPSGSAKYIVSVFREPQIAEALTAFLDRDDTLMLGICNGFQAMIKLGLLPYGRITDLTPKDADLVANVDRRHISRIITTQAWSVDSPWLASFAPGELTQVPISHGEGRLVASDEILQILLRNHQIAFTYAPDPAAGAYGAQESVFNPNGSMLAIEGLVSPNGRILGKMGHSERLAKDNYRNRKVDPSPCLFSAALEYLLK